MPAGMTTRMCFLSPHAVVIEAQRECSHKLLLRRAHLALPSTPDKGVGMGTVENNHLNFTHLDPHTHTLAYHHGAQCANFDPKIIIGSKINRWTFVSEKILHPEIHLNDHRKRCDNFPVLNLCARRCNGAQKDLGQLLIISYLNACVLHRLESEKHSVLSMFVWVWFGR